MMEAIAHEVCDPLGVSWEHAGMGSRDKTYLLESQAWPGAPIPVHDWLSCALNINISPKLLDYLVVKILRMKTWSDREIVSEC